MRVTPNQRVAGICSWKINKAANMPNTKLRLTIGYTALKGNFFT